VKVVLKASADLNWELLPPLTPLLKIRCFQQHAWLTQEGVWTVRKVMNASLSQVRNGSLSQERKVINVKKVMNGSLNQVRKVRNVRKVMNGSLRQVRKMRIVRTVMNGSLSQAARMHMHVCRRTHSHNKPLAAHCMLSLHARKKGTVSTQKPLLIWHRHMDKCVSTQHPHPHP